MPPYGQAADLGLSGQDAFWALLWSKKRYVTNMGPQPTSFGANEKVLTGSQLTFITQNEKVMIFCDLLTRGHNWPFRCLDYQNFLQLIFFGCMRAGPDTPPPPNYIVPLTTILLKTSFEYVCNRTVIYLNSSFTLKQEPLINFSM